VCPLNNAFGIFKIFLLDYKGDIFENQSFSWFIYSICYLFLTVNAIYLCYLCLFAYSVLTIWVTCLTRDRECLPSRAPELAPGF
jgi:hypothetical protein